MMLAFIGSLAIAAAVGWLVFLALMLAHLWRGGLEHVPGALIVSVPSGILTAAIVLWMLAQ